ncbi:odorant receptor 45a-like [Glossina fuscipes]|uniref:Odorant receptor n=1 Tax=Glossina fuscipes TaxID=7396 RepID=A0A9C5Z7Q1_9MUSC|nr:odorant receptor 45a-like [Glossina fuscipes]
MLLHTLQLKRYFWVTQRSFNLIGIDISALDYHDIVKYPMRCFLFTAFAAVLAGAMSIHVYEYRDDFGEFADTSGMLLQTIIALWKTLVFIFKRKEICDLMQNAWQWNINVHPDEFHIILKFNSQNFTISALYMVQVSSTVFGSFLVPLIYMFEFYRKNGEKIWLPPHKGGYFWDYSNVMGYSFLYICHLLGIFFVAAFSIGVDTLCPWLVSNIVVQYHVIYYRLRDIAELSYEISTDKLNAKIIECVKCHRQVLNLSNQLENFFAEIIFIKFVISGLLICSLAFRLVRAEGQFYILLYQLVFLTTVSTQLLMYCYSGQRLKDEKSSQVASEIYSIFEWSHLSRNSQKLLLFAMMRSQRECHLTGAFFMVDLSLFVWVLRTGGSLIAMLKTLDEKQV